jgi:hypothetical protein
MVGIRPLHVRKRLVSIAVSLTAEKSGGRKFLYGRPTQSSFSGPNRHPGVRPAVSRRRDPVFPIAWPTRRAAPAHGSTVTAYHTSPIGAGTLRAFSAAGIFRVTTVANRLFKDLVQAPGPRVEWLQSAA